MATFMKAGLAFVKRIGSTSNVISADGDRIERADGYNRAHTLPLHHIDPPILRNQTDTRTSLNSNRIDGDGQVDGSPLPVLIDIIESPETSEQNQLDQITTGTEIAPTFEIGDQTQAERKIRAVNYANAEYNKCARKSPDEYARGIGQLAAYQASSGYLGIYRLFKQSHNRLLIRLELEITELEQQLCTLELTYIGDVNKKHFLVGASLLAGDEDDEHHELSATLKEKIKEYDDIALKYAQMCALNQPSERYHRLLFDYMVCKKVLAEPYRDFVYAKDDFFCAINYQDNIFEVGMQIVIRWCKDTRLEKMFQSKNEASMNTDKAVDYHSSSRILNFARVISACLAVGVLLTPVYLLFLVPMGRGEMAITATAFLVLFSGLLSFLTGAKLEMVFIGTATYGAVLIMFLGNLSEEKGAGVS